MAAEFAYYFRSLLAALGERPGWYGVFAQRHPEDAAAYGSGRRLPPWDVVRTVLRDVAVNGGAADADPGEAGRAYALHRAAVVAEDALPGAADVLRARLDAAIRERDTAAARARAAARACEDADGRSGGAQGARLAHGLAWARDDLARASARCGELRERLLAAAGTDAGVGAAGAGGGRSEAAEVRRPTGARFAGAGGGSGGDGAGGGSGAGGAGGGNEGSGAGAPTPAPTRTRTWTRSSAPRGARFAGAPTAETLLPAPPVPAAGQAPSGARFAGAPRTRSAPAASAAPDPRWTGEAQAAAARLGALRRAGESGAAYLVLCAAAEGPADRIPYVVRELERTGLGADVATLLWEIAALPPEPLAEAAAALAGDGRGGDCLTLLRQAAARSPEDVAVVAETLHRAGRAGEAGELLETLARSRPAATAAAVARTRPSLAAPLLAAASRVSRPCHREISAALG
ncbi:hypothetical protein [Actinacidiphila reveromycinica]|uniref:hypothetical protein n=1 Tax=Actinacidiphila reveromycinica TaxID=659352 RepID=UPI001922EA3D|nr:hypothetical protein [Streptomyces sp. SN-593]